jgi:hypothetical protein
MKKNTWIYIVAAAAVYYYWLMKKKKTGSTAPSAMDAASTARQIVSDAVDQTTFVPDTTTFKDMYLQDQNACR